jgi:HlyD family secretion protein
MDRPLDPHFRRSRLRRRLAIAAIVIALAAGAAALGRAALTPSVERTHLRTARVETGTVAATLEASGTVVPAIEQVIASPIEARVVSIVRQPGAAVREGDEIVRLDPSDARLELDRLEQQLAQKRNERAQVGADLDERLADLGGQKERTKLDAEILGYKAGQQRTLRAEGLVSEDALRAAVIAARKAEIELAQLALKVDAARRSAAMDLAGLDAEIDVLKKEVDRSKAQLARASASADRNGVVTWVTPQEGAMVRRGDVVARVADLATLRIAGSISDVHAAAVRPGLPVRIRVGQARIDGRIAAIDPTVAGGVVRFTVEMSAPLASLRNNQRVDLDLLTGAAGEGLRLARGNFGVADGTDVVFRLVDGAAVRTPVRFGRAGADHIEVLEGLKEGDEVVVSDMDELWHARKVEIE